MAKVNIFVEIELNKFFLESQSEIGVSVLIAKKLSSSKYEASFVC